MSRSKHKVEQYYVQHFRQRLRERYHQKMSYSDAEILHLRLSQQIVNHDAAVMSHYLNHNVSDWVVLHNHVMYLVRFDHIKKYIVTALLKPTYNERQLLIQYLTRSSLS